MADIPERAGSLVDIGGRRLCARRAGSGSPTVIFENGAGVPSYGWAYVQDEVAKRTTTVVYDRGGIGWSEPGPKPRSAKRLNAELGALLNALETPPPWILVGHSIGALYALSFAASHRSEVVGLVLVDPVHPEVYERASRHIARRMHLPAAAGTLPDERSPEGSVPPHGRQRQGRPAGEDGRWASRTPTRGLRGALGPRRGHRRLLAWPEPTIRHAGREPSSEEKRGPGDRPRPRRYPADRHFSRTS
jgi:pimeloyl-ACP methyl ester carboxylesterase